MPPSRSRFTIASVNPVQLQLTITALEPLAGHFTGADARLLTFSGWAGLAVALDAAIQADSAADSPSRPGTSSLR